MQKNNGPDEGQPFFYLEHGALTRLCNRAGVSLSKLSDIRSGRINAGRKIALKLQAASGYSAASWMFPEEHPENPYMEPARRRAQEEAENWGLVPRSGDRRSGANDRRKKERRGKGQAGQ